MKIYEWNSYSCNNSSDIRLVAEFSSREKSESLAKELRNFLIAHVEEMDREIEAQFKKDASFHPSKMGPSQACLTFGAKYGYEWSESFFWGDFYLESVPSVVVHEKHLVVYETRAFNLGPDLSKILQKAGAKSIEEGAGVPTIYVSFDIAKQKNSVFVEELTTFFDQRFDAEYVEDWDHTPDSECAWGEGNGLVEDTSFFVDDEKCYYTFPLRPCYIENHKNYLQGKKLASLEMRIATDEDIIELQERAEAQLENIEGSDYEVFDPGGLSFLFTGKLASLTRKDAQNRVDEIGGKNAKSVTKTLDILVIGDEGSPLYGEGNIGSKQRKANTLNDEGAEIWIITETLFLQLKRENT